MCYNNLMSNTKCPQTGCNSPALLLLNLVCANPLCQNYNPKWHVEMSSHPRYNHKTIGNHVFLGGHTHENKYYDLYFSINPLDDTEWVEARYGDDIRCYVGEELEYAPLHNSEILREAARRWNERISNESE